MARSLRILFTTLMALLLLGSCSQQETPIPLSDKQVVALLDELFEEELQLSPEYMTYLGMRERYDEWDDLSDAARDQRLEMTKRHLAKIKSIDPSSLSATARLNVQMFIEQSEQAIAGDKWRYHNYPVNQMRGVHSMIPSFLINQHLIANTAEAEAYIGRVRNASTLLDQLIEQLEVRAQLGIVPPKFVFPKVIASIDNILTGAPFDNGAASTILTDFSRKIAAPGTAHRTTSTVTRRSQRCNAQPVGPGLRKTPQLSEPAPGQRRRSRRRVEISGWRSVLQLRTTANHNNRYERR